MKRRTQRGGSTLAAVMLLLALGLMLLNAQHRQLDNALLLAADQQRYLQAYNQAASALSWGMSQRWPRTELSAAAWLCRQRAELTACARLSARVGVVTVRGLGEMRGGEPLWLYQWGPMVTSLEEVDEAKRLIDRAGREVEEVLGYAIPKPKIGVMLEVPSMIFLIPHLAGRVDFISVGTNDLTQYLLAVDRNNTRVASLYDSLHPAMLQVLKLIAEQGKAAGLQLSLCGELAGDPMGALLLVGMGYRNLSMNGRSVARIKYLLRHIDLADAEVLAFRVLNTQMTTEVRHLVAAFMERRGMGGLIRGGR